MALERETVASVDYFAEGQEDLCSDTQDFRLLNS